MELGENCNPDTPLLRLVNTGQGFFVANVELGLSQRLQVSQKVVLKFSTGAVPLTRQAEITFISPVVDPASGLCKIKALFDNQDHRIIPGASATMLVGGP